MDSRSSVSQCIMEAVFVAAHTHIFLFNSFGLVVATFTQVVHTPEYSYVKCLVELIQLSCLEEKRMNSNVFSRDRMTSTLKTGNVAGSETCN